VIVAHPSPIDQLLSTDRRFAVVAPLVLVPRNMRESELLHVEPAPILPHVRDLHCTTQDVIPNVPGKLKYTLQSVFLPDIERTTGLIESSTAHRSVIRLADVELGLALARPLPPDTFPPLRRRVPLPQGIHGHPATNRV